MSAIRVTPWDAMEAALEYFEGREDVSDGDYGIPEANKEMEIAQMLREALESRPMWTRGPKNES